VRCRRVDVKGICLKSPGTLEAQCRRRDVEVFASRDRELGRSAEGVQTWWYLLQEPRRCGGGVGTCRRYRDMEPWRSGDAPQACRCGGVEVWSSGAVEMRCRPVDMEVWSSGGGVETCRRRRGMELWSSRGAQ